MLLLHKTSHNKYWNEYGRAEAYNQEKLPYLMKTVNGKVSK